MKAVYQIQARFKGMWEDYMPFGVKNLDAAKDILSELRLSKLCNKHGDLITFRIVKRITRDTVVEG